MAVTLTLGDLAVHLRLTVDPTEIPAAYMDILTETLATASAHVEEYAGADTPQACQDEGAIRMAGYLVDAPAFFRSPALAFRNSGCESLLAPWHVIRTAMV